ncbi:MAG: DUF4258 domain-containing protein [Flavobacteriaceae bacterium]|nr:DUF4258 domain-containing protein [Flavobacteriaceae bacterium]
MKLIQRVAWYSGGFIVGIIVLMFFLSGKKTSCDYGPNARTLKNIRSKEIKISEEVRQMLSDHDLDSTAILEVFLKGDVLFSESNTSMDSCKVYVVKGLSKGKELKVFVSNCNKDAKVSEVIITGQD